MEGFGVAEGAGEDEGSLEGGDHRDGEAAGGRLAETMPCEENRSTGDPAGEDVGGGLSQVVIGAGHLQGDGGDRAGVGVVAGRQVLSGEREGVRDRDLQVLVGVEDRVDEVTVERPGGATDAGPRRRLMAPGLLPAANTPISASLRLAVLSALRPSRTPSP